MWAVVKTLVSTKGPFSVSVNLVYFLIFPFTFIAQVGLRRFRAQPGPQHNVTKHNKSTGKPQKVYQTDNRIKMKYIMSTPVQYHLNMI